MIPHVVLAASSSASGVGFAVGPSYSDLIRDVATSVFIPSAVVSTVATCGSSPGAGRIGIAVLSHAAVIATCTGLGPVSVVAVGAIGVSTGISSGESRGSSAASSVVS